MYSFGDKSIHFELFSTPCNKAQQTSAWLRNWKFFTLHKFSFVKSITCFFLSMHCRLSFPINLIDQLQLTVTVLLVVVVFARWVRWQFVFVKWTRNEMRALFGCIVYYWNSRCRSSNCIGSKTSRTTNLLVSCNFKAINRDYYGHNLYFLIIIFLSLCRSHSLWVCFMSSAFVRV